MQPRSICRLFLSLVSISLVLLCGCGGSSTANAPATPYINLNGNWEAVGLPTTAGPLLASPIANFTGALQSASGAVTGTLRAFDLNFLSPYVPLNQDLHATGTLDLNGDLVLNVPISGGTATTTATLSQNLESYAMGTYQVSGGLCAMPSTAMALNQYAPVTGTYTGTLTSPIGPAVSVAVTAALVQATTPDADGRFPLTGSIAYQGSCSGSLPLVNEVVSGNGIFNITSATLTPFASLEGPITPAATNIHATLTLFSIASCGYLQGTLTRQ